MAEIVKGRGVRVEVGYTEGAPIALTALTQADPGVATAAGHGLAAGSVGYLTDVEGMVELDGQAVRVLDPDTNTFALERVKTTNYAEFVSGNLVPITAWRTLQQATQYQIGGGAGQTEESTVLLDTIQKQELIMLAAQTVTINLRALADDNQAMLKVREAAENLEALVFRVTLATGQQRLFHGQPSLPGEDVNVGGLGTGSLTVTVKGRSLFLPAVAP